MDVPYFLSCFLQSSFLLRAATKKCRYLLMRELTCGKYGCGLGGVTAYVLRGRQKNRAGFSLSSGRFSHALVNKAEAERAVGGVNDRDVSPPPEKRHRQLSRHHCKPSEQTKARKNTQTY